MLKIVVNSWHGGEWLFLSGLIFPLSFSIRHSYALPIANHNMGSRVSKVFNWCRLHVSYLENMTRCGHRANPGKHDYSITSMLPAFHVPNEIMATSGCARGQWLGHDTLISSLHDSFWSIIIDLTPFHATSSTLTHNHRLYYLDVWSWFNFNPSTDK